MPLIKKSPAQKKKSLKQALPRGRPFFFIKKCLRCDMLQPSCDALTKKKNAQQKEEKDKRSRKEG